MMKQLSILILDDEARVRDEIDEFLVKQNYITYLAARPSEALHHLSNNEIDIAIVDIRLPEMSGLEMLGHIKKKYADTEVIMISGHGDMQSVIEAMRKGAADYFQKPFRLAELNNAIVRTERFLELNTKLKAYNTSLNILSDKLYRQTGKYMIGKSDAMKMVFQLMDKVARTDNTSVLITGESGTGKELVAHGIHYLSKRSKNIFHSVNCSAITDSLFESEFFGHTKGSFTGAIDERQGWFEIANTGTLFLDEISDMPIGQQAKLLRALEERNIRKVGSHQTIPVDVRIIAASNQELEKLLDEKKFRTDLYHRLSTFIIHIPPLRDRKQDIPLLLRHFVHDFGQKMNKKVKGIDKQVIDMLLAYHFPGNIRELRNMVERAVILCDTNGMLMPIHFTIFNKTIRSDNSKQDETYDLIALEKASIVKALEKTGQNKTQASELLNISWQSLDRRIKKYGL
jgi:DNA-binding NtrC family response regulator